MGGKAKIGGSDREMSPGKVLINGTTHNIKQGNTTVNATKYAIKFEKLPDPEQWVAICRGEHKNDPHTYTIPKGGGWYRFEMASAGCPKLIRKGTATEDRTVDYYSSDYTDNNPYIQHTQKGIRDTPYGWDLSPGHIGSIDICFDGGEELTLQPAGYFRGSVSPSNAGYYPNWNNNENGSYVLLNGSKFLSIEGYYNDSTPDVPDGYQGQIYTPTRTNALRNVSISYPHEFRVITYSGSAPGGVGFHLTIPNEYKIANKEYIKTDKK